MLVPSRVDIAATGCSKVPSSAYIRLVISIKSMLAVVVNFAEKEKQDHKVMKRLPGTGITMTP